MNDGDYDIINAELWACPIPSVPFNSQHQKERISIAATILKCACQLCPLPRSLTMIYERYPPFKFYKFHGEPIRIYWFTNIYYLNADCTSSFTYVAYAYSLNHGHVQIKLTSSASDSPHVVAIDTWSEIDHDKIRACRNDKIIQSFLDPCGFFYLMNAKS